MDRHPLVVHIPIGLLVLYCGIEIFQAIPWSHKWNLFSTKTILLIFGTIGAKLGAETGEVAAEKYRETDLVELHGAFGELTVLLFIVISIIYLLWLYQKQEPDKEISRYIRKFIEPLYRYRILALFALLGFLLLSATGALGGALVHGPDPLADFLINIFIGQ